MAFRVGDVVRLPSGGPKMTVTGVYPPKDEDVVELCRCMYFPPDGRTAEVMVPGAALVSANEREIIGQG